MGRPKNLSGHLSSSDVDGYWARDLWLCPVRPENKRCPGPDPGSAANGLNATNREKKHLGSIDVNNSKAKQGNEND
jgi:hypothetical protein